MWNRTDSWFVAGLNNIADRFLYKADFILSRHFLFTLLLCGAELHNSVDLLCDTTAAELHNSVNLLCGTTIAELSPVWCMHQESQIFSKDSDEPMTNHAEKSEGLIQTKI